MDNLNLNLILYNVIVPLDSIITLQLLNSMLNYRYIYSSVICPIINLLAFSLILLWFKYKAPLEEKNKNIKQINIFILAFFEFSELLLAVVAIPNISYLIVLILGKLVLVFTMVSNFFYLQRRYLINHYLGVSIILIGVFLNINNKISKSETNILYLIIYICSIGINAFKYTFKEKFIKKNKDLNIYWLSFYISIWQLLLGIIFIPLIFIPINGLNIQTNNFLNYIKDSFQCSFLGINNENDKNCKYSLLWLFLTEIISLYIVYIVFIIVKKGSSVLCSIQNLLTIPTKALLSYFCFTYNIISVTNSQKFIFETYDYISLLLVFIGTLVYLMKQEIFLEENNINEIEIVNPIQNNV